MSGAWGGRSTLTAPTLRSRSAHTAALRKAVLQGRSAQGLPHRRPLSSAVTANRRRSTAHRHQSGVQCPFPPPFRTLPNTPPPPREVLEWPCTVE